MKARITDLMLAVALALAGAPSMMARDTKPGPGVPPPRPEGPCDIYAAAGAACVAAHSTTLAAGGFYLLGLSASGLAVPVRAGDTTIHVRSTTGMSVGDTLTIDTDGADTDSNCAHFLVQAATILPVAAAAGATNIKLDSVARFAAGQTITIDTGANAEMAVIATVGTAGATTSSAATAVRATAIPVASTTGFSVGQAITVGSGPNAETASVLSVSRNFGFGPGGPRRSGTLNLGAPLAHEHAAGAPVTGTGVTLTTALRRAHDSGAQVADSLPTPGAPNKYERTGKSR